MSISSVSASNEFARNMVAILKAGGHLKGTVQSHSNYGSTNIHWIAVEFPCSGRASGSGQVRTGSPARPGSRRRVRSASLQSRDATYSSWPVQFHRPKSTSPPPHQLCASTKSRREPAPHPLGEAQVLVLKLHSQPASDARRRAMQTNIRCVYQRLRPCTRRRRSSYTPSWSLPLRGNCGTTFAATWRRPFIHGRIKPVAMPAQAAATGGHS